MSWRSPRSRAHFRVRIHGCEGVGTAVRSVLAHAHHLAIPQREDVVGRLFGRDSTWLAPAAPMQQDDYVVAGIDLLVDGHLHAIPHLRPAPNGLKHGFGPDGRLGLFDLAPLNLGVENRDHRFEVSAETRRSYRGRSPRSPATSATPTAPRLRGPRPGLENPRSARRAHREPSTRSAERARAFDAAPPACGPLMHDIDTTWSPIDDPPWAPYSPPPVRRGHLPRKPSRPRARGRGTRAGMAVYLTQATSRVDRRRSTADSPRPNAP